jgi:hypothetical protein
MGMEPLATGVFRLTYDRIAMLLENAPDDVPVKPCFWGMLEKVWLRDFIISRYFSFPNPCLFPHYSFTHTH